MSEHKDELLVDGHTLAVEMAELRGEVHALRADLGDIKERIRGPRLGALASLAGTAAGVLLTIGVMALRPVVHSVEAINAAQLRTQQALESHARDGHPVRVLELLEQSDNVHTDEHDEQEEDIGELRTINERVEQRMDGLSSRVVRNEAALAELSSRVVGRTVQGFHRTDYESIIEPWLERHDREIAELRERYEADMLRRNRQQ